MGFSIVLSVESFINCPGELAVSPDTGILGNSWSAQQRQQCAWGSTKINRDRWVRSCSNLSFAPWEKRVNGAPCFDVKRCCATCLANTDPMFCVQAHSWKMNRAVNGAFFRVKDDWFVCSSFVPGLFNFSVHNVTTQRCGLTSWLKDGTRSPFVIMAIGAMWRLLPWSTHHQDIGVPQDDGGKVVEHWNKHWRSAELWSQSGWNPPFRYYTSSPRGGTDIFCRRNGIALKKKECEPTSWKQPEEEVDI